MLSPKLSFSMEVLVLSNCIVSTGLNIFHHLQYLEAALSCPVVAQRSSASHAVGTLRNID